MYSANPHVGRHLVCTNWEHPGKNSGYDGKFGSDADLVLNRLTRNRVLATYVEVQKLVKALSPHVHTKLHRVLGKSPGVIVSPLKRIARLRQLAFKIVSDSKPTRTSM